MSKKVQIDDSQWAGTESSLAAYVTLLQRDEERLQAGTPYTVQRSADQLPYLLSINNGIGVVSMKGPMTNRTSYYDEYDKRATYTAIREAIIEAATRDDVEQIVLDIDSGGGSVAGVADVAQLISNVNAHVKPVTAFTDGNMMSAAYWLGSSAGKVYASKVAGVGSIGVIAVHAEQSKMLADIGINVTVMRAGKFKALANAMEPLTEAAKEQMQAGLDATYGVFVQHVADSRGVTYNQADSKMAQGREFYGEAALTAGLIDGIATFDSLMSQLSVDKRNVTSQNSQNATKGTTMSKKALTEQQIAAIAAGAPLQAAAPAEPVVTDEKPEGEQAAAAADAGTTEPTASTEPTQSAGTQEPTPSVAPQADVVTFLQAQIKDKDAALLQANIDLNAAKAKITDFEASMSGLLKIASKSANNMRIALGGSAIDMSAMTAAQVLAEHDSVSAQFTSKFVAGGVAAVDAAQSASKKSADPAADAVMRARLNAAKPSVR